MIQDLKFKNQGWIVAIILLLTCSCSDEKKWDCVKSTGKEITEDRMISGFDEIYVEDKIEVELFQDTIFKVEVTAGENIIGKVFTELNGRTLEIRDGNKCNFMRTYKKQIRVRLHVPGLKKITHEGVGTIKSMNVMVEDTMDLWITSAGNIDLEVNCNKVLTHMMGTGDLTLSGTSYEHSCISTGLGFFDGDQLQTNYSWISWNATGNAKVRVSGLLIAHLKLSGDIYYSGNPPSIISEITGSGKLLTY